MSSLKPRVAKWDNAKAILIFLVVFGHAITSVLNEGEAVKSVFLWITAFHMPMFMLLTGLFSKSFVKAEKFNYTKIASYILLYFFMKLLIYLTLGLVRSFGHFRWTSEGGTPWYIFVTAVFMSVTYLLKNFNPKKVLVLAFVLSLAVGYISEIGDEFMLSRIFVYYPYFFLGYILDREKLLAFLNKIWIKILSAVIIIAFTAVIFLFCKDLFSLRYAMTGNNPYSEFGKDWAPFGVLIRTFCYILSTTLSFAFLSIIPTGKIPVLTKTGSKTLNVYALHRPALYAFQYTVMTLMLQSIPENWALPALFLVSLVLTFVLSLKPFDYVLYPCTRCDKWLNPITKWLKK